MARILVVDDHPGNCVPLVRLFRHSDLTAEPALNGPDAIALLDTFDPHLILLDVMMPDMDGFEVLRRIRDDRRYDPVVVLMYTAVADADATARAVRLGAQGYILKGTPFADVYAEVRRHLPG